MMTTSNPSKQKGVTQQAGGGPYQPLLDALRSMKAQNDDGFEGLMRDLLERVSGRTIHLVKSGPQEGKDIVTEARPEMPKVAIEAKRFSEKTPLSFDILKAKLEDSIRNSPNVDVWAIVASKEAKDPDWTKLQEIGAEHGVSLLRLDWRDAPGTLPVIAALCAYGSDLAEARLPAASVAPVLVAAKQHADYQRHIDDIQRVLTAPEAGFDTARNAARNWLKEAASNTETVRHKLGSRAAILATDAKPVARDSVDAGLDSWFSAGCQAPAVLLGDEGRGKTWAALSWCIRKAESENAPLVLAVSAKEIREISVEGMIAAALGRGMPLVDTAQLEQRLKRWCHASGGNQKILFLIDGLNEAYASDWPDIVARLEQDPWSKHIAVLMTCRPAFWQNDLGGMQIERAEPITEIRVEDFSKGELKEYLTLRGLAEAEVPANVLKLMRRPRFASLALRLRKKLEGMEEITEARLVLEDWKERLTQKGATLLVDDKSLRDFIADIGKAARDNPNLEISQREIHAKLSNKSGLELKDYKLAISEIADGHWLRPTKQQNVFTPDDKLLPYAIGLDLVRTLDGLSDPKAITEEIAKCVEHLDDADFGVVILRAATTIAFCLQGSTPEVYRELLFAWAEEKNFKPSDFEEMCAMAGINPQPFIELIESGATMRGLEEDRLAKCLVNAAQSQKKTMDALVARLPKWVGAYSLDPMNWGGMLNVPGSDLRQQRTQNNLEKWLAAETGYSRKVSGNFHISGKPGTARVALNLMSYLPRGLFIDTIITWAVIHVIAGDQLDAAQFNWLLRFNQEDPAVASLIIDEAKKLQGLKHEIADRAAMILLYALGAPDTNEILYLKSPAYRFSAPDVDGDGNIIWDEQGGAAMPVHTPVPCAMNLSEWALDPGITLKNEDCQSLRGIVGSIGAQEVTKDWGVPLSNGAELTFARWAPTELAALLRRVYSHPQDLDRGSVQRDVDHIGIIALIMNPEERCQMRNFAQQKLRQADPQEAGRGENRAYLTMLVASSAEMSAADQITLLQEVPGAFGFPVAIAQALLTPPTTDDVRKVCKLLRENNDITHLGNWLSYLGNVRLPALPDNADILLELARHESSEIRDKAIISLFHAENEKLGAAFAESSWSFSQGMSSPEAMGGSYLLAHHGKHLEFNSLQKRVAPQALPYLLENRGMQDGDVKTIHQEFCAFLDAGKWRGEDKFTMYSSPPSEAAWDKIVGTDLETFVAKAKDAAVAHRIGGFCGFPTHQIARTIMKAFPEAGAEVWSAIKINHQSWGMRIGDFDLLPFSMKQSPAAEKLWAGMLDDARNDGELSNISYALDKTARPWLFNAIANDIKSKISYRIARGITLAGFCDFSPEAAAAWDEIHKLDLKGWLGDVRSHAREQYERNQNCRHWFTKFLGTKNLDEAYAYLQLLHGCMDRRYYSWHSELLTPVREQVPDDWLRMLDMQQTTRRGSVKATDDQHRKRFLWTPIIHGMYPWQ